MGARHAELVALAGRWLNGTCGCVLVATERQCSHRLEKPDAIGWKADGRSILVECKTSLSDFRADHAKPHRIDVGMGRERWYLAEEGVLRPDGEWPAGWGLLLAINGRVYRRREAEDRAALAAEIALQESPLLVAITRRATQNGGIVVRHDPDVAAPTPPTDGNGGGR